MKRLIALLLLLALVLVGCQSANEPKDPLADWLEAANLDAEETPEQLYAAAQNEGMLVIYSTSSRMFDVAQSFEAQYPGLMVQVENIREGDVHSRIMENYAARDFKCDIILSADARGVMQNEYLPASIAVKYVPYDIADNILPGNNGDMLSLTGEAAVLAYSDTHYTSPPVHNWWELTEEQWRGMVYMPNPVKSTTTLAFFNTIIDNSEMMAQAYEDLYGVPLELPQEENAGREFVRRLVANDLVILNSSDETAEQVGFPGSDSPALGILVSSKLRLRDIGYEMMNHYEMEPFCGVYVPNYILIAGGAPNVNTAKLFIRWILGEADGTGEGYQPYLRSGAWSVRNDVQDDSRVRMDELNLLHSDRRFLYENHDEMIAFWESLLTEE